MHFSKDKKKKAALVILRSGVLKVFIEDIFYLF